MARPPHRFQDLKAAPLRGYVERRPAIIVGLVDIGAGLYELRVVCVMHESTRAAAQNDVEYAINGNLTDLIDHV